MTKRELVGPNGAREPRTLVSRELTASEVEDRKAQLASIKAAADAFRARKAVQP